MTKKNIYILISILILFAFAAFLVLPIDGDRLGRKGFLLGLDVQGGSHLVYEADLTKKDPSQTDEQVMDGVIQKIERRVNAYGVTEPLIQREGTNRIIVQLPGIKNIDEAVKLIGQVALLEFKETTPDASGQPKRNEAGDIIWKTATATGSDGIEKELTGKYLKPNSKVVLQRNTNVPEVAFEWNDEGAVLFEQITKRNLQKPLGIFLDNQLISDPTVQAVIKSSGVITGPEIKEAQTLSIQLNSGSLDVPLTVVQRMDVDATLGADSLKKSLYAGFVGLALVALFMLIYYRLPGLLAICALLVYGSVSLAIFKMIPVTLTLPAIAGFIISIGMAVDANVLVFERMKEELRSGRTLGAAVEEGFRRAWPSIRDSNISTFITCLILYWFGGTFGAFMVQGFAITLFLGVVVSMFSALIVTRTFLRVLVGSRVVTSLSAYGVSLPVSSIPMTTKLAAPVKKAGVLDFVGKKKWFFLASAVIIIPGVISLGIFHLKPGVDFSSGTAMTIHLSEEVDQSQLRQAFTDLGYSEAIIQHTGTGDYLVRVPAVTAEEKTALTDGLAKKTGKEVTVRDFYAVSPVVAGETAGNAIIAVAAAAIGILLYIAFAFRKMPNSFRWGTCAVVALIHDVLLVLGVFSILGWALGVEVDAMFITAMLTVVGYSVHDTIVVFDRIRENMTKNGNRDFEATVNSGIVETLARSLNTSLTVILVVLALFLLGGTTIHFFTLALLIGVITGTYSSIGNASQLLVVWQKGK
ncbi:MAG: protein translocase subunit SecD [Dehalococcoidia bacterium]